jgi:hypothetical protein
MDSYSHQHVDRPIASAISHLDGCFVHPNYQSQNCIKPMQSTSFSHASKMQQEFFDSSTSAMFMTPISSQMHMPLYNHDGQYNNVYSANCFVPNTNNSTVLTSVSQNFSTYDQSVGFSSNMQQPFYQAVACSTPPSPPISTGVPFEPVPNVYSNVSPQHTSHAQPSLPELQSHSYVASMS